MLFISMPSLTISFVLAVFYLANLAFFAANRHQETDHATRYASYCPKGERHLQYTAFSQFENDALQHTAHNNTQAGNLPAEQFYAVIAANRDFHRQSSFDFPVTFDPGISWKLFFRPPPTC